MRHRVKGRKLSRTSSHRKATMRALTTALVKEHRIVTTIAKAKELRRFIEPLITRAKEDNQHNRSQVFSSLQDKYVVAALFNEVGPKSIDRPGGYTRIVKIGFRQGDGAEMAVIELVDFNDVQPEGKGTKKKRTRRAGKSNTAASSEPKAEAAPQEDSVSEIEETESAEVDESSAESEENTTEK
ncbi:MAG: 50S ribosomal protein L17 [Balneolaceae bacterium]